LSERGALNPWETGIFTYQRGGVIEAHDVE